jgi:uncharacterized protein YgiM (DUF1202 family)
MKLSGAAALSLMAPAAIGRIRIAAASDGFAIGDKVFVATDALNFRYAAGINAGIFSTLQTGAIGTITGGPTSQDGYTWYQADFGEVGWVDGEYLQLLGDSGTFAFGDKVEVATDRLNLRFAPGADSEVLYVLVTGDQGTITGPPRALDGYVWYEAQFDGGRAGFVAGEFLQLTDGGGQFSAGDAVQVATDDLNLRSGAGLSYDVLAVLSNGDGAVVVDGPVANDGYDWYQINLDSGGGGWVAGDFLQLNSGTPGGFRLKVVDGPLNVRSAPSLDGDVLDTIPTGATVRVLQADSGTDADGYHWVYVQVEDADAVRGFIADAFTAEAA